MIGRGGLWTADEIKLMADYLGSEFGLQGLHPNAFHPNACRQTR
jgi:hypothetical protein